MQENPIGREKTPYNIQHVIESYHGKVLQRKHTF